MIDFKTFTLPRTMPLHERISETGRQIREWIHSHKSGFDCATDHLRLAGFKKKSDLYSYRYEFLRNEKPLAGEATFENDAGS